MQIFRARRSYVSGYGREEAQFPFQLLGWGGGEGSLHVLIKKTFFGAAKRPKSERAVPIAESGQHAESGSFCFFVCVCVGGHIDPEHDRVECR